MGISQTLKDAGLLGSNDYDLGDMIFGGGFVYGLISVLGMGTSTIEGHSIGGTLATFSGYDVPLDLTLALVAIIGSFWTNDGLSPSSLLDRPLYEKVTAFAAAVVPIGVHYFGDFASLLTGSIEARLATFAVLVIGYLVVGYRSENSKKVNVAEKADPTNWFGN